MHIIKHFITITKHRNKVMKYCFKCHLYKQGIMHDLSKYSFTEFIPSAKYYQGTYSPNHNERLEKGYSIAWLHHKGKNKHHLEYWIDVDLKTHQYMPVDVPKKYIAESICDRIAASKIYNKNNFIPQMVKDYYIKESKFIPMTANTNNDMTFLLDYYVDNGEKELFKYIRKSYLKKKR